MDPVKAAEMALTKKDPNEKKEKEVRMSAMSDAQVMERLRSVVTLSNPLESYNKQKKIGQGASGSVYVARIRENAPSKTAQDLTKMYGPRAQVAIKQMDLRSQPRKELIVNEIIVMKESRHDNIVNFLDAFLQEDTFELWVVMEFMEGGALTDVIDNNSSISEDQIATICLEVSKHPALHYNAPVDLDENQALTYNVMGKDLQRPHPPAQPKHHSPRHQIRQRPALLARRRQNHRLRLLRQTYRAAFQTRHHGRHALLDGARSRQAEGIRLQSRHLVPRHHGDRDDRVRAALPQRGAPEGAVLDRDERHAAAEEAREVE
jgi:hypothetical protein